MPNKSGTSYFVTDKDCETAFAQCKACEFIADNRQYKSVVDATFLRVSDNDEVNAYCAHLSDEVREYLLKEYPGTDYADGNNRDVPVGYDGGARVRVHRPYQEDGRGEEDAHVGLRTSDKF